MNTTPNSTPSIHERAERIAAWLELVALTKPADIDDDATWALGFMYGAPVRGFHAWEIEHATHAWNFAVRSNIQHDHGILAHINADNAIDAAIDLAYELLRVAPVRTHILRFDTSADQFLVDLFISIHRIRHAHERHPSIAS